MSEKPIAYFVKVETQRMGGGEPITSDYIAKANNDRDAEIAVKNFEKTTEDQHVESLRQATDDELKINNPEGKDVILIQTKSPE